MGTDPSRSGGLACATSETPVTSPTVPTEDPVESSLHAEACRFTAPLEMAAPSPGDAVPFNQKATWLWRRGATLRRMTEDTRSVELVGWNGPWEPDDPDANFKADVALYARVDPMSTISRLAAAMGMPEGAVVHYVLAKWASAGSGGLLELGPSMVHRLWAVIERAEEVDTSEARLEAYEQLRQMVSWLRIPLINDGAASGY